MKHKKYKKYKKYKKSTTNIMRGRAVYGVVDEQQTSNR